jgi:type II secretory pathway pseudopilin PulG
MRNQRGFTLLEGVIVFCLIAIVAAIAAPKIQKMTKNSNLKAAARDIMGDISNIRGRALSENTSLSIPFDTINTRYTVPGRANPKSPKSFSSDITMGVNFVGGLATLTFQTRGTILPPGTNSITLTNGLGSTATIIVLTAGRIYVQYALKY